MKYLNFPVPCWRYPRGPSKQGKTHLQQGCFFFGGSQNKNRRIPFIFIFGVKKNNDFRTFFHLFRHFPNTPQQTSGDDFGRDARPQVNLQYPPPLSPLSPLSPISEARGFGGISSGTMLPRDTATDAIRRWPSAGGCPAANILLSAGGDLAILFTC